MPDDPPVVKPWSATAQTNQRQILTCGLCDAPERDIDPLVGFDLPGGAVELRCRRHPSYRQIVTVADPIHPSNLRREQAG